MTEVKPIGELIEALIDYRGKTPPKSGSGVPLITAKVIKDGTILSQPREYIDETIYDSWMRRGLPRSGDILITTEAPLGEVAQVGQDARIALAQRVILLRADPKAIDRQFLFHYLRSPDARARLLRHASGTTVSGIRQSELRMVTIPLLPRPLQRIVGRILDDFDAMIENNRRRVELLEEMTRAIYREWFVHFRFPGHSDTNFVDSSLGPIPEGWTISAIDQLVKLVNNTIDPADTEPRTPAVGLEHIPRRRLTMSEWGRADELGSRKATFFKGDLLFGKIRPYFHKVSVAPIDGICSTDAVVIRPIADHWGQAVQVIFSDEFVAYATQTSNGTKMPRANWNVIKNFPITIPPKNIGLHFTRISRDSLKLAENLMFQGRCLSALRNYLLPRLVTGQVDVSSLDLDSLVKD
jgi:type I restriction enzyme, S subunit